MVAINTNLGRSSQVLDSCILEVKQICSNTDKRMNGCYYATGKHKMNKKKCFQLDLGYQIKKWLGTFFLQDERKKHSSG